MITIYTPHPSKCPKLPEAEKPPLCGLLPTRLLCSFSASMEMDESSRWTEEEMRQPRKVSGFWPSDCPAMCVQALQLVWWGGG